jgi:hypothetical protein
MLHCLVELEVAAVSKPLSFSFNSTFIVAFIIMELNLCKPHYCSTEEMVRILRREKEFLPLWASTLFFFLQLLQ